MSFQISTSAILLGILAFLASRAAGGVVSEYAKRFWFKYLEPLIGKVLIRPVTTAIAVASAVLRPLGKGPTETSVAALELELARVLMLLERALRENEALLLENIQLRVQQNTKDIAS